MHRVFVRTPDCDDTDRSVVAAKQTAVKPIGLRPGKRRGNALLHDAPLQLGTIGWKA